VFLFFILNSYFSFSTHKLLLFCCCWLLFIPMIFCFLLFIFNSYSLLPIMAFHILFLTFCSCFLFFCSFSSSCSFSYSFILVSSLTPLLGYFPITFVQVQEHSKHHSFGNPSFIALFGKFLFFSLYFVLFIAYLS